jgi:adenylosuccinate lyase
MSSQLASPSTFGSTFASTYTGLLQRLRRRWAAADQPPHADAGGDAASVRALADSYQRSDPGFARDLYAAADRHERALDASAGR